MRGPNSEAWGRITLGTALWVRGRARLGCRASVARPRALGRMGPNPRDVVPAEPMSQSPTKSCPARFSSAIPAWLTPCVSVSWTERKTRMQLDSSAWTKVTTRHPTHTRPRRCFWARASSRPRRARWSRGRGTFLGRRDPGIMVFCGTMEVRAGYRFMTGAGPGHPLSNTRTGCTQLATNRDVSATPNALLGQYVSTGRCPNHSINTATLARLYSKKLKSFFCRIGYGDCCECRPNYLLSRQNETRRALHQQKQVPRQRPHAAGQPQRQVLGCRRRHPTGRDPGVALLDLLADRCVLLPRPVHNGGHPHEDGDAEHPRADQRLGGHGLQAGPDLGRAGGDRGQDILHGAGHRPLRASEFYFHGSHQVKVLERDGEEHEAGVPHDDAELRERGEDLQLGVEGQQEGAREHGLHDRLAQLVAADRREDGHIAHEALAVLPDAEDQHDRVEYLQALLQQQLDRQRVHEEGREPAGQVRAGVGEERHFGEYAPWYLISGANQK
ncbi:hypothetical protein SS50377_26234 [Spironucleus salmonicida]|uniref:Uncharacterized protein n=1 Tax=Spironucleus salmonicida TaxID=348837 RepID=A0A9P8RX17_9EUKA|nr:hypothetical protein SS50377_26234 [Spironucleus salmonicida]